MTLFERSEDIFEDENILHDNYQPRSLEERDHELEQYTGYLQPVINGAQPRNIFLYGKTPNDTTTSRSRPCISTAKT